MGDALLISWTIEVEKGVSVSIHLSLSPDWMPCDQGPLDRGSRPVSVAFAHGFLGDWIGGDDLRRTGSDIQSKDSLEGYLLLVPIPHAE